MKEGESATRVPELGDFRLGDWLVCQAEGTLGSEGRTVRLEPRVMDVLVCLAATPAKVVPKEELLEVVWGGTFVEEGVLSQAVHSLRKALGDDARQPRFIQTIPKRGYRLVAEVRRGDLSGTTAEPARAPRTDDHEPPPRARPGRRHPARLLVVGLIGLAAVASWIASKSFRIQPMRIVVLPFENIGKPTEEDASFTYGLTEEITNGLASIPSLQVIARPSALQYTDTKKTVLEIGGDLKVQYVLGGTVQWGKDVEGRAKVRIIPRLSRVADNTHLPCPAFEQRVDDTFEAPEKISRVVIGQLNIVPRKVDEQRLSRRPTDNLDAYWAYLRGLGLKNQPFYSEEHLYQAIPLFERAARLDPNFAAAWAELSQTHSYLAFNSDPSPGRIERSRQALNHGLEIDSRLLEVRLARAYYRYRCLGDYASAERLFTEVVDRFPNNAEALQSLGLVLRRRSRLAEAIQSFEQAATLNPREPRLPWWIGETHRAMRQYARAEEYFRQATSMAPEEAVYWSERALNQLAWTGDPKRVHEVLAEAPVPNSPAVAIVLFQVDLYQRAFRDALARITPEVMQSLAPQVAGRIAVLKVVARERLGDRAGALGEAEENRRILEARVGEFPKDTYSRAYLAVSLAQLGRAAEALVEAEKAVRQARSDEFSGLRIEEVKVMVDSILRQKRDALDGLAKLLATPYQSAISRVDIVKNPVWDPIRDDPRFTHLVNSFSVIDP